MALGYTLVYGILQLINFAHGDVFALSGLVASTMIISVFKLNEDTAILIVVVGLLGTLVVTVPLFALLNGGIERVAYKPLRNAPRLAPLITEIGPLRSATRLSAWRIMSTLVPNTSACVGQALIQAGSSPTATRSEHSVHL